MNNKELATGVFKHPLIQEILKQELAGSSVVNRLIVEEIITEDELDEAPRSPYNNIKNNIGVWFNQQARNDVPIEKQESNFTRKMIPKWTGAMEDQGFSNAQKEELLAYAHTKFDKNLSLSNYDPISKLKSAIDQALEKDPNITWEVFSSALKKTFPTPDWDKSAIAAEEHFAEVKAANQKTSPEDESSTAEIAGNVALAADLIAIGLLATGAGAPAAFVTKGAGVVASIVEAAAQYNDGNQTQAVLALLGIFPIAKIPFAKKFIGKILASLAKSPVAAEALKLAITQSIKKLSGSEEEAKNKLEDKFSETEKKPQELSPELEVDSDVVSPESSTSELDEPAPVEEVAAVVDETIKAAPKDFKDATEPEKQEFDKAIIENMDEFFGETEGKYSFMNRFFLSDQSQMLYNLVGNLNKILGEETGKEGGRDKALREESEPEDHITIPWSKNSKVSLKRELGAFASLLRESKRITETYNKYATQSSIDPRFDGSSLKRALTGEDGNSGIMGDVQWHTAKLADLLANIIAESKSEQPLKEALSGEERKAAIITIRETYNKLGQLYINSLRPTLNGELDEEVVPAEVEPEKSTLSPVDSNAAEKVAREMLNLISKDPGIIKYFPRGIVNNQGKVVTLEAASKALDGQIKAFAKVLRDINMTMKDESVSPSDIARAYGVLKTLAQAIENSFGVDSLIKRKTDKILSKELPEENHALGDEPVDVEIEEVDYPHYKNEVYQELSEMEKEAVDEFVRVYLEISDGLDESRDSVYYKKGHGEEASAKLQKGLSLANKQIIQLRNKMDKTKYSNFLRTMISEPQIIDMIVGTYGKASKGTGSKIGEQKIIEKLTPIIEQFLKEK